MLCQFQVYSKVNQLYVYTYPLFFRFFSHIDHYRKPSRVPCALQQVFISYLFYIYQRVYVNYFLILFTILYLSHELFFNFFFFLNYTILGVLYLFINGCVGPSFLCEGFLQLWQAGATLHRGARASHYRGLSRCGAQAPDAQAQQLWLTGPFAPWHVGSSQTRARTRVSCIGRQILNHCATREAPSHELFRSIDCLNFQIMKNFRFLFWNSPNVSFLIRAPVSVFRAGIIPIL